MSRQEKLASWQQLRADKRNANGLQDPNIGKVAVKEPVKPVEVIPEEIIKLPAEEPITSDPVVQEPVLQKFGKKKKVEDTE